MRRAQPSDAPQRWFGAAFSLFLHAVLIALVVTQLRFASRGSPASPSPKSIQITMTLPSPAAPKTVPRPTPPLPPKPVEPPKEQKRITPEPTPVPVKPQPPKKPTPPAPAPAAAAPKPPGATTQKQAPAPPTPPVETPEESLIGSIHDNWLEPAVMPRQFNCRIRIDYLAGGRIASVKFLGACVNHDVEESVRRAVWKTQPLPLPAAKAAAGFVEIEFTP